MADNRENQYLENIADGVPAFDNPRTEDEVFLANIANGVENTRNANTRFQYWLKQIEGGGGGSVTVEPLTVTQNGTTTAPSGTAYSPITVNVQPTLQNKSVTIDSNGTMEITPDSGYDGLSSVEVTTNVPTGGSGVTLFTPTVTDATHVSTGSYEPSHSIFCCLDYQFGCIKDLQANTFSIYYVIPSTVAAAFTMNNNELVLTSGSISAVGESGLRIVDDSQA